MEHETAELRTRLLSQLPWARARLAEIVAMPSVADPAVAPRAECERAAQWVADAVAEAGLTDTELVPTIDDSITVLASRPARDGAPTVLLYCHYDVQPAGDETLWASAPFTLTDGADGRWYGRGAADCKGNLVAHLLALRALEDSPLGIRFVAEGSEEQGGVGLEALLAAHPERFAADVMLIVDSGNIELGHPTLTTSLRGTADVTVRVRTLEGAVHSGLFGGAAPDAVRALTTLLASLWNDEGDLAIVGLDRLEHWRGVDYPADELRRDAGVLAGVELPGSGSVADRLWARHALTVVGMDVPPLVGAANAISATAAAKLNLRVPPGADPADSQSALVAHLEAQAPGGTVVEIERHELAAPFSARIDGPGYAAMADAMSRAFGTKAGAIGQGGSIPLCNALATAHPNAEIMLYGVEEPSCRIHAPNESVDPQELLRIALAETLFLRSLG